MGTVRKLVKQAAKKNLTGKWGVAIALLLVAGVITSLVENVLTTAAAFVPGFSLFSDLELVFENINDVEAFNEAVNAYAASFAANPMELGIFFGVSLLVSLLVAVVTAPLQYGQMEWYITVSDGKEARFSQLFSFYSTGKKFFKSFLMNFSVGLRQFLYMLPFMVLYFGGAAVLVLSAQFEDVVFLPFVALALILLGLVYAIVMLFFMQRYFMAQYLLVRFPDRKINELIRESIALTKGHRGELVVFYFSFIGWHLLTLPTCGLIVLFVEPYIMAAAAVLSNHLFGLGKSKGIGDMTLLPPRTRARG